MSQMDTATFYTPIFLCHAMQYLCQLVGAIGIHMDTHTCPCGILCNTHANNAACGLPVDNLWITCG